MIKVDKAAVDRVVGGLAGQITFAHVVALTRTGQAVKSALRAEMESVFDRPTPYTLNALMLRPATPQNPKFTVEFKFMADKGPPAWKYLGPQVVGGGRKDKRSEVLLRQAGILPAGMQVVPGYGADIDRYGNMSRGQIVKILSSLRAMFDPAQNKNSFALRQRGVRRREQYFVGGPNLKPGIYKKQGDAVVCVMRFVRLPVYTPRFDFYGVAGRAATAAFPGEFRRAVQTRWQRKIAA